MWHIKEQTIKHSAVVLGCYTFDSGFSSSGIEKTKKKGFNQLDPHV